MSGDKFKPRRQGKQHVAHWAVAAAFLGIVMAIGAAAWLPGWLLAPASVGGGAAPQVSAEPPAPQGTEPAELARKEALGDRFATYLATSPGVSAALLAPSAPPSGPPPSAEAWTSAVAASIFPSPPRTGASDAAPVTDLSVAASGLSDPATAIDRRVALLEAAREAAAGARDDAAAQREYRSLLVAQLHAGDADVVTRAASYFLELEPDSAERARALSEAISRQTKPEIKSYLSALQEAGGQS